MSHVVVEGERCKGCGLCIAACPQSVLAMGHTGNSQGYCFPQVAEPKLCIGCCLCAITCPDTAISITQAGTVYSFFER